METAYPEALFQTPGMITVLAIVIILQIASLLFFGIVAAEFRVLRGRHKAFFQSMSGADHDMEHGSSVVFWMYLIVTIIVTLVSMLIFIYQPHLL